MVVNTKRWSMQRGNTTILLYSKVGAHSVPLLPDRGFSTLTTMSLKVFYGEDKMWVTLDELTHTVARQSPISTVWVWPLAGLTHEGELLWNHIRKCQRHTPGGVRCGEGLSLVTQSHQVSACNREAALPSCPCCWDQMDEQLLKRRPPSMKS